MAQNDTLTAIQHRAITSLVAGRTVAEAAADCHSSERQLYRWKREQAFRQGLHQAKQEVLDHALGKLVHMVDGAIATLALNMQNNTGAVASIRSVQVRAAQALLDAAIAVHRTDELEQRITELEELLADEGTG